MLQLTFNPGLTLIGFRTTRPRCPAVLLGEGRPDTRERQKSNLGYPLSLKLLRLISLLCNILMPTLSQYVNLVYLTRSYDSFVLHEKVS